MQIQIQSPAISGCEVEMSGSMVKKSCNPAYTERLMAQAEKQKKLGNLIQNSSGIQVPKVFYTQPWNNCFFMEYLPYVGYIDFVHNNPIYKVKEQLIKIIYWLEFTVEQTNGLHPIQDSYSIVSKEISKPTFPREMLEISSRVTTDTNSISLPIGFCHGDMTLSNFLFGNNIAMIDFNDVIQESPIIDIIKLRQDTLYHWTLEMSLLQGKKIDVKKITIVDDWLNYKLEVITKYSDINMDDYKFWEAFNYLKIFRNASKEMYPYLENIIEGIIK